MTDRPLLSMCLIARDEAHNVNRCFSSWWDAVDEVVLVDTGSVDNTIVRARAFARKRKQPGKLKIARFKWRDDFAAARQAADDLATGQWVTWCDLDDTIDGMSQLRGMVADAAEDVVAFFARYCYARDADGNPISELWRERVVRHNGTPWTGRLHEHKLFTTGTVVKTDPHVVQWVHHRNQDTRTGERNLRILEAWLADEPENPRVMHGLAMELLGAARHAEASDMFARVLQCPGEPLDRRAQCYRYMCVMLIQQGRVEEARAAAFQALQEMWMWADTHLTFAEIAQTVGQPAEAIRHAVDAMVIGKPDTILIVNPLQYTAHPLALQAICLAQLGRFEEAVQAGQECLRVAPSYQLAGQFMPAWTAALKRDRTAKATLALADVMLEAGELVKAHALLGAVPYYVDSDPRILGRRMEVARAIDQRVAAAIGLEDPAADEIVERLMELAA